MLKEDMVSDYLALSAWNSLAAAIFGGGTLPENVQLWKAILILEGAILVSEKLLRRVVWAQHTRTVHLGRR